MTVIASLDLATLTNNPASIAEALEDVLEVTAGNLGSLKNQAESDANTISDTLLPAAQSAHDQIIGMSSATNASQYHYTTLLNGFVAWDVQTNTGIEHGVRVQNLGAIWIVNIVAYNTVGTGPGQSTIVNIANEFTLPTNQVIIGNSHYNGGNEDDMIAGARINTSGDINIYWNNITSQGIHIVGNFIGLDAG